MSEGDPTSWILQVRQRLAEPPATRLDGGDGRHAAVLVPLYVDAGELWTLLTRRSAELPEHQGQIAFPGGGLELGEDAWQAALRESEEELGIDPTPVLRLGELDEVATPSGYRISPCVGAVPFPLDTRPAAEEIAEVFAVPLSAFANPRLVERRAVEIDGLLRDIVVYHVGSRRIWGVTAEILANLLARLVG